MRNRIVISLSILGSVVGLFLGVAWWNSWGDKDEMTSDLSERTERLNYHLGEALASAVPLPEAPSMALSPSGRQTLEAIGTSVAVAVPTSDAVSTEYHSMSGRATEAVLAAATCPAASCDDFATSYADLGTRVARYATMRPALVAAGEAANVFLISTREP